MRIFNKSKIALGIVVTSFSHPLWAEVADDNVMVVTASGFQQKIEDSPASISIISHEQLQSKAYRDVTDALQDVPGVVVTGGGSHSDISIRGMAAKYTLILVDGKRVDTRATRPNSDGSGIEQGWLPPLEAIERIEVVRGPMSSLYGSDAIGGVINIITRKNSKTWQTAVRGEITLQESSRSGNNYQSNAYTAGSLIDDLLSMRVTGSWAHRIEDKIVNGFNDQQIRNGGALFTLTPDQQNSFDIEAAHYAQDRDSRPGRSAASTSKLTESRYRRDIYSLTHTGQYDGISSTSYFQQENTRNPSRHMSLKNSTLNTMNAFELADHTLNIGGQYRYEQLKDQANQLASAADLDRLTRWSWALFAEDEWRMTDDFALTTGIRMDKDEKFGAHWSPRLYGVWHLAENWTVKGGVSTGYRSPDIRQAVDDWGQITGGGGDPAIIVGNSALKPEKSVSEEIGLIWNNQHNTSIGLTLFNTNFKDKITEIRRCTDSTGQASGACVLGTTSYKYINDRENVDKAEMRGVETTAEWDILDNLTLSSSYSYTHSKQKSGKFKGKALNKMPRHMVNSSLDWQTTEQWGNWIRLNYRGRTSEHLGRVNMSNGTPSYTFVDLGMSYQLMKSVQLFAGVYNLFDKRVDYDTYETVLDGRRYTIGLNTTF